MERDPLLLLKLLLATNVAANIALLFLLLHK